jgi:hypothetical protein
MSIIIEFVVIAALFMGGHGHVASPGYPAGSVSVTVAHFGSTVVTSAL